MPRLNPILVQDVLQTSCRAGRELLAGRWRRPVGLPETQRGYQQLPDAAQAGRRRWLLAVRARRKPPPAEAGSAPAETVPVP